MDSSIRTRRHLLGSIAVVSASTLAGCLFGDDDEDEIYDGETFVDEGDEPDYDGYLSGINYPGTVDWTDTADDELIVYVGTGLEGMGYAPRSVRIEAGSTLTWEWTGEGGRHDVVDTDDTFASDQFHEEGATFEHTFEEPGTYTYFCTPHEHRDMKGGVEVV